MQIRKTLAALTAAAMLFVSVPVVAVADGTPQIPAIATAEDTYSGTCGENVTWQLDMETGTMTISGSGDMKDYRVMDAPWQNYKAEIKTVIIEDGVTSIWGFALQRNLEKVIIKGSVKTIGIAAFMGCTSLSTIELKDSLETIGLTAFMQCSALEEITIPLTVTSIEDEAFSDCTSLRSITILNPECAIKTSAAHNETITNENGTYTGVIRGYTGSTAQAYAEKYSYQFEALSGEEPSQYPTQPVSEEPEVAFKDVLDMFRKNVSEGWANFDGKTAEGILNSENLTTVSPLWLDTYKDKTLEEVGYWYTNNSLYIGVTPELRLMDVYTLADGKPVHLYASGEKRSIGCNGEPMEHIVLSDGAFIQNCFTVQDGKLVPAKAYKKDETGHWLSETFTVNSDGSYSYDWQEINKDTIDLSLEHGWGVIRPDLIPLSENAAQPATDPAEPVTEPTEPTTEAATEPVTESTEAPTEEPAETDIHSGKCGDNLTWALDFTTGTLTISGTGEMTEGEKSGWYDDNLFIKRLIIEEGVTGISSYAFLNCGYITSAVIPGTVTHIGEGAFSTCRALSSVTIPDGLTAIEDFTFSSCDKLSSVTIPDSVTRIGKAAFRYCCSLKSITIPDDVTEIGEQAFLGCDDLTSITVPDGVASIGDCTFLDCIHLEKVIIPDSVTSIEGTAFIRCDSATIYGNEGSYAQQYANENQIPFKLLSELETPGDSLGDIDDSGTINASDAANVLIAAAVIGAGKDPGLTDAQKKAADVNGDGATNASDAAIILQYAAYIGAGNPEMTLAEYMLNKK
ncbi:MAG: leucine-rich repeat protein [Oscillospiraceae bacterium]|nr:leucine-rich repeat protein [Oscillospiraceae bacterium]